MRLAKVRKGLRVRESIGGEAVTVVAIRRTFKYGPRRCVCVRFCDRSTGWYSPRDLRPIKSTNTQEF